MRARLSAASRLASYPLSGSKTLTTKWTTVTKKQEKELVGLLYKGAPFVEFDEAPADEVVVEDAEVTAVDADQEDESNGTQ